MHLDICMYINKIITHPLPKNINLSLTNRCATVELNLQRRYDDSVTNKLKFKLNN